MNPEQIEDLCRQAEAQSAESLNQIEFNAELNVTRAKAADVATRDVTARWREKARALKETRGEPVN